ncbi:hypothetical protein DL96DRAFT_1564806 [Flagelloscypha sp. PMI_526]|nr:hypothetical protein DL96DRAFT_1564806 [Flagelloscypha sp. PMI_526]
MIDDQFVTSDGMIDFATHLRSYEIKYSVKWVFATKLIYQRQILDTQDSHLLKHTKSLTLEVLGMPVVINDTENLPLLISLLRRFQGHRLESFCIDSRSKERQWFDLSPVFQDVLSASILPFVSSLQLLGIAGIPLPTVLVQCPLLKDVRLGADYKDIDDKDLTSWEGIPVLPGVKSLSFWVFGKSDLREGTSLARYIQSEGTKIEHLEFTKSLRENYFPVSFLSLEAFFTLRQHLFHLSFGLHLQRAVVAKDGIHDKVPLRMFLQLRTLQFTISTHSSDTDIDTWTPWSNWLASMLTSEIDQTHPLRILRIIMDPDRERHQKTALDDLAEALNIQIHVCIDGNGNNTDIFEDTVVSVRNSLPSWDEASKLKCWMRLGA